MKLLTLLLLCVPLWSWNVSNCWKYGGGCLRSPLIRDELANRKFFEQGDRGKAQPPPCNNNAGESVRWHVTMGSTPITGKTPGASDRQRVTASILPGVFVPVPTSVSPRHWLSALAVEPARCLIMVGKLTESTDLTAGNRPALYNTHNSRQCEQLDIYMILAQRHVESGGDHGAVSKEHCVGQMQIHPDTARDFGIPVWTLDHPVLGLDAGITIMSTLWTRFENVSKKRNMLRNETWKLALGAYNCGYSRTIKSYLTLGENWQRGIPVETRQYIVKVLNRYKEER